MAPHRVTVSATFRPRIPHVEPKDTWSNVMIETLPADGMLKRNGERVVHSGTMVLDAGSYEFRYEAPGHRREFQTRLSIEAGQTYGLLINLDNPFGARLTDLRRFGRAHSADANLVRLPDGRWLVAFCRDYKNIMVSTSDRNRLLSPTDTMNCPNVLAAPVRVMVPMMMPTTAHATPTGSAVSAQARMLGALSPSGWT